MKSTIEVEPTAPTARFDNPQRATSKWAETVVITATALYAVWFTVHYRAVYDPDIWWHLRVGDWVLSQRAVPQTDWLSSSAQGKPWVLYSWFFDVIVAGLYRAFGLFGPIIAYPVTMVLLIAAAVWALMSQLGLRLSARALIGAGALVAIAPILSPRPGLFSVLFFTLELWLILRAEHSGSLRSLYFLPLVFMIWANVHIQFIYGLFALALWAAEPWIAQTAARIAPRVCATAGLCADGLQLQAGTPAVPLMRTVEVRASAPVRLGNQVGRWLTFAACAVATLASPYTYKVYVSILQAATQGGQYSYISELQSPTFRSYNSFAELFVILAAWLVLGTQRTRRWMVAILLIVASVFAFRAVRDVWFGVLAAVFVFGVSGSSVPPAKTRRNSLAIGATVALVLLGTLLVLRLHPLANRQLWQDVSEEFPVKAVQYVKDHNLHGPIYNDWYWGGFLTWSLPDEPVYVDSRTTVLGDEVLQRSIAMWNGASDWASDPELSNAGLIIANPENPLTSLLRFDRRFRVDYEDSRAVVFVRSN